MKNKGSVILEFVISMAIISILLVPIMKITQNYFILLDSSKRINVYEDEELTTAESLGYSELLTKFPTENYEEFFLPNIGLQSEPYTEPIIHLKLKIKDRVFNKILTEISEFKGCD